MLGLVFQLYSVHIKNSISWKESFFSFIYMRTSLSSLVLKHFNNRDYQLCFIGFDFFYKSLSKAFNKVLSAELIICFRWHFLYLSSIDTFRLYDCNNQVSVKPYLVWQIFCEIVMRVFVPLIKGLIWLLAEMENLYWFFVLECKLALICRVQGKKINRFLIKTRQNTPKFYAVIQKVSHWIANVFLCKSVKAQLVTILNKTLFKQLLKT